MGTIKMGKEETGHKFYLLSGTWGLFLLTWAFVQFEGSFRTFESANWTPLDTKTRAEVCLAVIALFCSLISMTFALMSKKRMVCIVSTFLAFACATCVMGIKTHAMNQAINTSVFLKMHEFWFGWIGVFFSMVQLMCSFLLP